MSTKKKVLLVIAVIIIGCVYWVFKTPSVGNPDIPTSAEAIARGEYLVNAGGCGACHQNEGAAGMTGGHALEAESPFGDALVFYAPNITPDEETGIGGWTGKDFLLAIKHGREPDGGFYWPAFPFRSYAGLTDEDVLDMAAYLMAQPAIANEVPEHEMPAWQFEWTMAGWNIMADFLEGEYPEVNSDDPQVLRGEYLARALGHCGECHTPRHKLGMMLKSQEFMGSEIVGAQITPQALNEEGWTAFDFVGFLQLGMLPNFDFVATEMLEVIDHTALLTEEDQAAYAAFFLRETEESE